MTARQDADSVRERMVAHATDLIARHGVTATSIGDVLAAADAPRGSVYHHFPGGKSELMAEAVRNGGRVLAEQSGDQAWAPPREVMENVAAMWRRRLVESDFAAGCPIAAGGVARSDEPTAADAADELLTGWGEVLAARLRAEGCSEDRARSLSALMLAGVEGAVILCRTRRTLEPLDDVMAELRRALVRADGSSDW